MSRYTHDCDACEFLGEHEEFDLYYCARCDGGTIIARYSDDGPDYASTMLSIFDVHIDFYKSNPDYRAGQALLKAYDLQKAKAA